MKYGLIGKSLIHSYSKEIHESLGLYSYDLFSLTPEEVSGFVNAKDFGGLNVTIPYKQDVISLCDEVSELAAAIGAVNTLYWQDGPMAGAGRIQDDLRNPPEPAGCSAGSTAGSGAPGQPPESRRLVGHNTDYEGFLYTAARSDIDFAGKTVLILGTGGTSLMVRKAVLDQGASAIYIASRKTGAELKSINIESTISKSQQLRTIKTRDTVSDFPYQILTYGDLTSISDDVEIIVNTTPVGTFPNNLHGVIDLADFPSCEAVIDVIYNPFKTKLLLDGERAGLKTANGLPMLVAQATAAAGYFVGTPGAFEKENERIIKQLTEQMRNIVLIGMPGSGKSTIGKFLAEITGKKFVDMDDEIIGKVGKPIPEIFDEVGESGFRDLETEVALELGKNRGWVIATGGGAILRPANVDALRQNGQVIHIRRPVEDLAMNGRPLSRDITALREMERDRGPLYLAAADTTFDNSITLSETQLTDKIIKELL